jgi:hypothetical protein
MNEYKGYSYITALKKLPTSRPSSSTTRRGGSARAPEAPTSRRPRRRLTASCCRGGGRVQDVGGCGVPEDRGLGWTVQNLALPTLAHRSPRV